MSDTVIRVENLSKKYVLSHQQEGQPDDYVIATGHTHSLDDFVAATFAYFNLDWQDHVVTNSSLFRPTDISVSKGNPAKAKQQLGWQAASKMEDVVRMMIEERSRQ